MKILILMGSYFPKPSANGICAQQIVNKLRDQGFDVTVVATKTLGLSEFEIIDGVEIYRIKGRWFNWVSEWCENKHSQGFIRVIQKLNLLINRFKNFIFIPLWPLISPLYTFRLYRKAKELHNSNEYNGVISIYNPIDALIAGTLLKKKYKELKLVLYFLDTLSGGIVPQYFSREWLEKRGWFWESKFFKVADSICVMESHRKNYFREIYKPFQKKIKVVDIPLLRKLNPRLEGEKSIFSKEKINLVYTGLLLKKLKNPTYMLELLNRLNHDNEYSFQIFGGGDCFGLIESYKTKSIKDSIVMHGQVKVSKVHEALSNADILVNIGSSVDSQIPGKIFEYIASGKPIISTYQTENEPSIPYLKKYPLALLIKEDWENIDENVLRIIEFVNFSKGKTVSYDEVEEIFVNNTADSMVNKVLELMR
jgi:glycosyltransferase involved in cell wall biosynthesis